MRMARVLVGAVSVWISLQTCACSDGPQDREQVFASYEGTYAIEGVERFVDSCSPHGAATAYDAQTNFWAAILTRDAQGPSLEGTGCKDVEFCQAVAAELKQGKPPPQGYYDFEHLIYSWVGINESPRGWGFVISSSADGCHKDLSEYLIRREGDDTLFDIRTREGLTYEATASGSCAAEPEVDAESLLQNRCLMYEVIRTRFVSAF